jgi:hypothetical protein
MANWEEKPRSEWLEIAVDIALRGWGAEGVAEEMVRQHYRGKSPERALALFLADINELLAQRQADPAVQQQAKQWAETKRMGNELYDEGWKPVPVPGRAGEWFWRHEETGVTVNLLGGGFPSYTKATEVAYNSQVRQWVLHRQSSQEE